MPRRKQILANEEVYHVFNRGIDGRKVFVDKSSRRRFWKSLWFYRFGDLDVSISRFLSMPAEQKALMEKGLEKQKLRVSVLAGCLMDNHFHLLLRQEMDGGISRLIADLVISYTRWFNLMNERRGPLFSTQFKAVRIENEEQLLHVSRYIHLNPMTGYLVKSVDELLEYQWSSLPEYLGKRNSDWIEDQEIVQLVGSRKEYKKFLLDQVDYQRELKRIGHLLNE